MSELLTLGTRADFRASLGARILHDRYGGDYDAMLADWAQDHGNAPACPECGDELTGDRWSGAFCASCNGSASWKFA